MFFAGMRRFYRAACRPLLQQTTTSERHPLRHHGLARELARLAQQDQGKPRATAAGIAATPVMPGLAGRLSQWLDVPQAMSLFAALNGAAVLPENAPPLAPASRFRTELEALQANLAAPARLRLPAPQGALGTGPGEGFSPYHRYYQTQQREMEAAITPLRLRLRQHLALHSPAMQRLAALDAVLDQAFGSRERQLLMQLPLVLAQHFDVCRSAYLQGLAGHRPEAPATWLAPGGWLCDFSEQLQRLLHAELEFRLLPVTGLLLALEQAPQPPACAAPDLP